MGTIDDIKAMKVQGKSEQEIRASLKQKGVANLEVENALSQSQIKEAVSSQPTSEEVGGIPQAPEQMDSSVQPLPNQTQQPMIAPPQAPVQEEGYPAAPSQKYEGMQPSVLEQNQEIYPPEEQQTQDAYSAGNYQAGNAYPEAGYDQYQPYQEAMSSDVITEISEQVVSERLSVMQDKLEEAINFKSIAETKISGIDERLRRIEKIIDKLQMSLLQKVGDYVNDVSDIKREMLETQKSFKKLAPEVKHRSAGTRHPHAKGKKRKVP